MFPVASILTGKYVLQLSFHHCIFCFLCKIFVLFLIDTVLVEGPLLAVYENNSKKCEKEPDNFSIFPFLAGLIFA